MALALQPLADDVLGAARRVAAAAQRVDVGGIQEVDAAGGRGIEDRMALRRIALEAEGHGPEAEPRDAQAGAAETDGLHDALYPPMS